jgi:glucose-6-phosphate 1-dehydrogenase
MTAPTTAPTTVSDEPSADALVMFGLTGDLGEQQLLPALLELRRAGLLDLPVIGVGRRELSDDELRSMLHDAAGSEGAADDVPSAIDLSYVRGDATDPDVYDLLAERLAGCERPVVYAALPPELFGEAARRLAASPLPSSTRLVVEKPFGHDATHACELYDAIVEHVDDEHLFLVDHFLAKPAVENLIAFRAANPLVDAVMRAGHVARVEITMAEEFGVSGRGSFYDGVGAVADVVQNHVLQLVALLAMDPPEDDSAEAFAAARSALLAAVDPIDPDRAVLGQYRGYAEHDGVADGSTTETFVAAELAIRTERWDGVPFLVRTGKRLAGTWTEAVVVLSGEAPVPNRIRFRVKPDPAIEIELGVLDTALRDDDHAATPSVHDAHDVVPTTLTACAPTGHGELGAYATMLAGALAGERRHFARIDDVVAAWRVVDPLRAAALAPQPYAPGSMGPGDSDGLAGPEGWVTRGGPGPDGATG